jgi:hypothetical protein
MRFRWRTLEKFYPSLREASFQEDAFILASRVFILNCDIRARAREVVGI